MKKYIVLASVTSLILAGGVYVEHSILSAKSPLLESHPGSVSIVEEATHLPDEGCEWISRKFRRSQITFFEQNCFMHYTSGWVYYEDGEGNILSLDPDDGRTLVTMRPLKKSSDVSPYEVILNDWYAALSVQQKEKCSIQDADISRTSLEAPRTTPHKIRFKIDLKPDVRREIVNRFGGLPSGKQYDFLCGNIVGSHFSSLPPYFEFDDRSPERYLFLRSFGNDDSTLVDLNSIRF